MKRFLKLSLLPLFALSMLALTGCESTTPAQKERNVSTQPWNRPQSWEGQGQVGSMMGGGGGR